MCSFIDSVYLTADKETKDRRIAVSVPLFSNPETRKNVLQVVHRWLNEVINTVVGQMNKNYFNEKLLSREQSVTCTKQSTYWDFPTLAAAKECSTRTL